MANWERGRGEPYWPEWDPYAPPFYYYPFPPPELYAPPPQWAPKADKRQQRDFNPQYPDDYEYPPQMFYPPGGRPPRMYPYPPQPWGYPYPPHGYPPGPPFPGKAPGAPASYAPHGAPSVPYGHGPHGAPGSHPGPSGTPVGASEEHGEDFDQKGELPQQVGASVLEDEALPPRASHKKPHQAAAPGNAGPALPPAAHQPRQAGRFVKAVQSSAPAQDIQAEASHVVHIEETRGPVASKSVAQAPPADFKQGEQVDEQRSRRPTQSTKPPAASVPPREKPKTNPTAAVPIPAPAPSAPKPNSWSARVGSGGAPAAAVTVVNKVAPKEADKAPTGPVSTTTKEPEKGKDEKKERVLGRKAPSATSNSAPVRPRPGGASSADKDPVEANEGANTEAAAPTGQDQEAEQDGWQSAPAKPRRGNVRKPKQDQ